jgi:hypothetical protein
MMDHPIISHKARGLKGNDARDRRTDRRAAATIRKKGSIEMGGKQDHKYWTVAEVGMAKRAEDERRKQKI